MSANEDGPHSFSKEAARIPLSRHGPPPTDYRSEPTSEKARSLWRRALSILRECSGPIDVEKLWGALQMLMQVNELEPNFAGASLQLAWWFMWLCEHMPLIR